MANPATVNLTANTWGLVAEDVTTGQIKRMDNSPNVYLETYRMTGETAPTSQTEGVPAFIESNSEPISATMTGANNTGTSVGGF